MISLSLPILLLILGLALLILILIYWRVRSGQAYNTPLPPPPGSPKTANISSPRYADLVPDEITKGGGFSAQLQTASYNLRIETVKDQTRYVVNGVAYNTLNEIPNAEMRKNVQDFIKIAYPRDSQGRTKNEVLRLVQTGNQSTIESRAPNHTISIQKDGKQTRYIVNGLTYYNLKEISDLAMYRKAKELLKKMP